MNDDVSRARFDMLIRYSLDELRQRKYEASAEGGDYIDEPVCLESDVAQLESENAALKAGIPHAEKMTQKLVDEIAALKVEKDKYKKAYESTDRELHLAWEKNGNLNRENAALKAQHERDEKAMMVLAEMKEETDCRASKSCFCPDTFLCGERGCAETLVAYAKQEAGK